MPLPRNFDRQRELRNQQAILSRIERRYIAKIAKLIRQQTNYYIDQFKLTRSSRIDIKPEFIRETEQVLMPLWSSSLVAFSGRIIEQGKACNIDLTVKRADQMDLPSMLIAEWLDYAGGDKIVRDITQTTIDQVINQIQSGLMDGLSVTEIAGLISSNIGSVSALRAQVIATTEAHNAAGYGAQETAKIIDAPMLKEWIASGGGRTRDAHSIANGQTVQVDEPFRVGGELLMYPGDARGSAANIINCRCAAGYLLE